MLLLVTHSSHVLPDHTRSTLLTNGSNLSTRLPTRSTRLSASIYLSTRSTRSNLCRSLYNWSVIMSNQMFYPSNN